MRDYNTADGMHTVKELMAFMQSSQHRFFFGKIKTSSKKTIKNPSVIADLVIGLVLVRPNVTFSYDKKTNDIIAIGKTNQFLNACYTLLYEDYHLHDCFLVPELNGKTLDESSSDEDNIDYLSSSKLQKLVCTMQLYKSDDQEVINYIKNNHIF